MADALPVIVKTVVSSSGANNAQTFAAFNTAMTTAIAAAQLLAAYPATANQRTYINGQQPVVCDPVGMVWDGTNYNYYSAVNYVKFV